MPEPTPTPQFEDEIRAALETPPARPEFVSRLQSQLLQQASTPAGRHAAPRRPFFLRPVWAAALVLTLVLVAGTLIIGPQRIVSAFASLFDYLPGIGLVQNDGSLRLLDAPVQVQREGITLAVEQGAADPTHTVLIYHVEGLSLKAANSQGEAAPTGGPMVLLLPDGSFLSMTGAQMQGWGTGYQTRLVFPALPAGVNEATLLIYRLETMPAGVAPEDWRIPLIFKPAPPDLKVMPVYELATAPASTPGSTEILLTSPALTNQSSQKGITLSLDKVVELPYGFQLQGSFSWEKQQYDEVMFKFGGSGEQLFTSADGQSIPFETANAERDASTPSTSNMPWAIQTQSKGYPGPWKLTVPRVGVTQSKGLEGAAFQFDFGSNPQVGQTWPLDQEIDAAGHKLHLVSASLGTDSRSQKPQMNFMFEVSGDVSLGLGDANPGAVFGSGMSRGPADTQIEAHLDYFEKPTGVHTIRIASISYALDGPWQVSWNPPANGPSGPIPALANQSSQKSITLSLDKVIELADGYQLQGSVSWDLQQYSGVMLDIYSVHGQTLTSGDGQPIPLELANADTAANPATGNSVPWALRTNNKSYPGPWTLTVPSVQVFQGIKPGPMSFQVDFGPDPKIGQTWHLDQELEAAGQKLHLVSAGLEQDSRSQNPKVNFVFETAPDVSLHGVIDMANLPDVSGQDAGAESGGSSSKPGQFETYIVYFKMPTGVHTIQVNAISYFLAGPWQVSWDTPATGLPAPTQAPQACFDSLKWQQVQEQAPVNLPEGLSGRLLLETNTGQLMPQMTLVNPDGSGTPQVIAIGGWSDLSPDGATAAFIKSNGPSLFLADVQSGEIRPVPNSTSEDYHPVWSPDGQWLAFVRSLEGVYVIHPDGTGLKQVADYTGVPSVVGFLPDNRRLVVTVLGAGGSQVKTIDIQTGQVQDLFTIANAKGGFALLSPDGKRIAFAEMTFGLPSYGIYVAALDGSDKRLVAGLETGGVSATAWSPDGQWLALTVMQVDGGQETETPVLLNLDTCQAYPVPGLSGRVVTWR